MYLNQEKKIKSRRQNRSLWEWTEIFRNSPRAVFTYVKLSIKFVYTFFTGGEVFSRLLVFIFIPLEICKKISHRFFRFNKVKRVSLHFLKFAFLTGLIFSWIFSGWPRIYNFPPEIKVAQAALPTFFSCGAASGSTGAITPALPSSIVTNDILLLFLETAGTAITIPTPNGGTWAEVLNSPQDTGATITRLTVFWSRYNGTQTAPVTSDSGDHQVGVICAYRGIITTGDPWDVTTGGVDATSDTSGSIPGATTSGDDRLIVIVGSGDDDADTPITTVTNADLANISAARVNAETAQGNDGGVTVFDGEKASAGAYGATSLTYTAATTKGMMTIALKPPLVVVDTPAYDNGTATYNNDVSVAITVASPASSVICYTTNGDTPAATTPGTCSTGTTYSVPVSITATGTVLKAIGTKAGYANSAVQSATYTLQVANPSFGTNGGSFNNDTVSTQTSTTTGAVFCQTVDGTTNPEASTPGTCSVGTTGANATVIATGKTIKALGTKANYVNSAVQTSNTFTLTVGAITSIPGAGTYGSTQSVTLSIATTTGAVVHYTTDGSAVTCSSTTYIGAFNVSVTTTVKAIGCKTNYVSSAAISDLYTINLSTAIEIRAQNYTTSVSSITFPEGTSGATVSQPYNNINGSGSPQTFGGAGTAKPVVTLYNGNASTLTIWYNITTFTNSVVSSENYIVNAKGAACADASCITGAVTFDADTTTGTTILAGAGNEKDFYLKITLGTPAGKSGSSTLTILGEAL